MPFIAFGFHIEAHVHDHSPPQSQIRERIGEDYAAFAGASSHHRPLSSKRVPSLLGLLDAGRPGEEVSIAIRAFKIDHEAEQSFRSPVRKASREGIAIRIDGAPAADLPDDVTILRDDLSDGEILRHLVREDHFLLVFQ